MDEFQFVWTTSGEVEWSPDSGTDLVLTPGTLILARPGMRDHWRWRTLGRHGYVVFDIDPRPDTSEWPFVRPTDAGPIAALLDYLLWLGEEPVRDWMSHAERTIDTLIWMFTSAPLPQVQAIDEHPALTAALDHVKQQWYQHMRPVSVDELAAAACVTKEHVARLFKRHYGTGIVHALELVRLTHGESLLTQTNLSVAQVADSCGFVDALYFSKRFRSAYRASPQTYRNSHTRRSPLADAGLLPLSRRLSPD